MAVAEALAGSRRHFLCFQRGLFRQAQPALQRCWRDPFERGLQDAGPGGAQLGGVLARVAGACHAALAKLEAV